MIRRSLAVTVLVALSACGHEPEQRTRTSAAQVQPNADARPSAPGDTEEARGRRAELLGGIVASGAVTDPRVIDAIGNVPRHLFVEGVTVRGAYQNAPLSIGYGQTTSEPSTVAKLAQALELTGRERVLEIGTGSGYQAAVLSRLAREVYTVEIVPELAEQARMRLERLGYTNVHVLAGNGMNGWPDRAPFDRVLVTAQVREVPRTLASQVAEGGILVAPVGEANQGRLLRESKVAGRFGIEDLGALELDRLTE
jgi:protein-L-isoaspartate(D-aspartate) O-methyltransferase